MKIKVVGNGIEVKCPKCNKPIWSEYEIELYDEPPELEKWVDYFFSFDCDNCDHTFDIDTEIKIEVRKK